MAVAIEKARNADEDLKKAREDREQLQHEAEDRRKQNKIQYEKLRKDRLEKLNKLRQMGSCELD